MKERYISLMNKTLDAYSHEHILEYFDRVKREGLTEHGFPRLTANIGILIAHGYRVELTELFIEMMDFCCSQFPRGKAANDFSIKEVIFCIMALTERGGVPSEKLSQWKSELALLDPYVCYDIFARTPTDKVYNWACFCAVSEYMRQYIGLCDTSEFVDIQIPTQLQWIDENGMYRDAPSDPPITYDLVPRGLFAMLLNFGYNGKYRDDIDRVLKKAGPLTLEMQSVTGEVPYGGRSNQFLHNEAHIAIICEFEAKRYAREGNSSLSQKFKAAAVRALESIEGYLNKKPITHVKNRFPIASKYGCENYAYFDKYMITTASFLYAAYLISDDSIIPSEEKYFYKSNAFTLSVDFHKVFLRCGGYSLEFDTYGDPHYDCSGLGRVHKHDAPGEICLSTPCPKAPNYTIGTNFARDLSLCAGAVIDGEAVFATDRETEYEVVSLESGDGFAKATIKNRFVCGYTVTSDYLVTEGGVEIKARGEGKVLYMLPAFYFDGEIYPEINKNGNILTVSYNGYCVTYTASEDIYELSGMGYNRNGYYKPYFVKGNTSLTLKIKIEAI